MNDTLQNMMAAVSEALRFQKELGLSGIEAVPTFSLPKNEGVADVGKALDKGAQAQARTSLGLFEAELRTPRPAEGPDLGDAPGSAAEAQNLEALRRYIGDCRRCKLCEKRTHVVFGVGSDQADIMFVGEGPGRDEDLQGEPFVGRAGELLDRMILAMGIRREGVYITNIVKCRPPRNRDPEADEVAQCEPFLRRQIELVQPRVVVAMGRYAVQTLLRDTTAVSRQRGRWRTYENIDVMPTFHPAYLLRSPDEKKKVWADLQLVMQRLALVDPRTGLVPGA